MTMILLLVTAAFGAGVMNAVAGGGSFLTFPALVFSGVPSVAANASSTVVVFPAQFASAWAFRHDRQRIEGAPLAALLAASIAGGITGALLLLFTPQRAFDAIVPWLLLAATLLFAFGRQATPYLRRKLRIGPAALIAIQYAVAIYGGYFGGAVGIVMLAVLGLYGLDDLNAMNATKAILAGTMNGIAVVCFLIAGKVVWGSTIVMLLAALVGGYVGARVARRIDQTYQRWAVTAIGVVMTIVFFMRR